MGFIKQKGGKLAKGEFRFEYHRNDDIIFYGETEDEVYKLNHLFKLEHNEVYKTLAEEIEAKDLVVEEIISDDFFISSYSLVGIMTESYPVNHGNYWSISINGNSYPVANIWLENYEHAIDELGIKELKFNIVNGVCIISDEKIPNDYYMDKLFMKYNLHKSISYTETQKINDWYIKNHLK